MYFFCIFTLFKVFWMSTVVYWRYIWMYFFGYFFVVKLSVLPRRKASHLQNCSLCFNCCCSDKCKTDMILPSWKWFRLLSVKKSSWNSICQIFTDNHSIHHISFVKYSLSIILCQIFSAKYYLPNILFGNYKLPFSRLEGDQRETVSRAVQATGQFRLSMGPHYSNN